MARLCLKGAFGGSRPILARSARVLHERRLEQDFTMISRRFPLLLALAGVLAAAGALAQTPLPPSIAGGTAGEPAPAPKPAKPRPKQAKPADGTAPAKAASKPAPQRGYSETLPLPRKIDRDDIADPYGGGSRSGGNRVSPSVTPSGRMGMGGRF
jgi:hypothetical protein